MPYKIVQTLEKGRSVLTSIPDTWENDGILLWPKKMSEKLRKNEKNYPQDDWLKSNCIVKRRNISTYEEAEQEIENMCKYSDTEQFDDTENEDPCPPKRKKRQHKIQPIPFHNEEFNSLAEECILDKEQMILPPNDENVYYTLQTIEQPAENLTDISKQLPLLLDNQKLILNNQKLLSENQQILILKIGELATKFEGFVKECSTAAVEHSLTNQKVNEIEFKIISSKDDVEELETKLKDVVYISELKKKFSVVCGKGKGLNNAYVLIDLIFSREFLNKCSWAGGSRKEESKICFRAYTRIFDFFFDLIYMTDKSFTKEDCKIFFKNILRNSMSRIKCKQNRASSSRNRPKAIKHKIESEIPSDQYILSVSEKVQSSDEEGLC